MSDLIKKLQDELKSIHHNLSQIAPPEPLPVPQTLDTYMGNRERTLIIGGGEIGKSLQAVLSSAYDVHIKDREPNSEIDKKWFRVIHICFPYSSQFIEEVEKYNKQFRPELVIIHSTIKPETTKKLGSNFVHSPVNGKHPNLAKSILTFTKFVGGNDIYPVFAAVAHLNRAGIKTQVMADSTATELAKILCTTYYGWNIVFMKEVARLCQKYGVPFQEVYTEWNNSYNQGYSELGEYRFLRPVLFPLQGTIGGHCVIPNCDLLDDYLTEQVKGRNETYKQRKTNDVQTKGLDMPSPKPTRGRKKDDHIPPKAK